MESSALKQSSSTGSKMASMIDVSQLDKVNAIPNKQADNVLMDGLCQEDQFYLSSLMDESSSNSDDDQDHAGLQRSSAWSPMMQDNPVKINKRMRKMRSTYAITMSLEDISYIRPSWGVSKGIKRIELNNKKKLKNIETAKENQIKDKKKLEGDQKNTSNTAYHCVLFTIMIIIIILILYMQLIDNHRYDNEIHENKIQVEAKSKRMDIFKPTGSEAKGLIPLLKLNFGQGIPDNLKYQSCTCEEFNEELLKLNSSLNNENDGQCLTCLNWAMRANLRVYISKERSAREDYMAKLEENDDETTMCYDFKWQSYDGLRTPLRDCFVLGDGQWYGLGDIQSANSWPLNKLRFSSSMIVTNLSAEFNAEPGTTLAHQGDTHHASPLLFGSHAKLSLLNSEGVFIGNLRSDFQPSIEIRRNSRLNLDELCLSVSCTDKCGRVWSRLDRLSALKHQNNILEYQLCTNRNLKNLISRQFKVEANETHYVINNGRKRPPPAPAPATSNNQAGEILSAPRVGQQNNLLATQMERLTTEVEATRIDLNSSNLQAASMDNETNIRRIPEGIGLIERTIFATSREFMPALDGQSLRLYVDNIVKLGLKTSSIILVDTRWETHVGSYKLNSALFPKPKLLFEILHNKGFKIVLTIKPYIDTSIGISNINQLLESGRLYTARYRKNNHLIEPSDDQVNSVARTRDPPRGYLIRRRSFFKLENETITTDGEPDTKEAPYMIPCKESADGYCVLVDVTRAKNRQWLIEAIKRTSWLVQEADGIMVGGAHPDGFQWDDHYREGLSELVDHLFYKDHLYTLAQWTGNFGYVQLAPRRCDWPGLQSTLNSILNLALLGFPLVHPGSVWGDLEPANVSSKTMATYADQADKFYDTTRERQNDEVNEELIIRWLQVSVFFPILQFNNLAPIEKYGLQEQLQNLVKLRKVYIVPELKRNLPPTPLVFDSLKVKTLWAPGGSQFDRQSSRQRLPLIRPIWLSQDLGKTMVSEQFSIGPDLLVAPILAEGHRQRDIYLPNGFWRDELRQTNIRGGKWLRNYPIELNEIAWFTRARRR